MSPKECIEGVKHKFVHFFVKNFTEPSDRLVQSIIYDMHVSVCVFICSSLVGGENIQITKLRTTEVRFVRL